MSARKLDADALIAILEEQAENGPPSARIRAAQILLEHHRKLKEPDASEQDPFAKLDEDDDLTKQRRKRAHGA